MPTPIFLLRPVRRLLMAATLGLGLAATAGAQPAPWPSKPVKLMVGFPGGSTPDSAARALRCRAWSRRGSRPGS